MSPTEETKATAEDVTVTATATAKATTVVTTVTSNVVSLTSSTSSNKLSYADIEVNVENYNDQAHRKRIRANITKPGTEVALKTKRLKIQNHKNLVAQEEKKVTVSHGKKTKLVPISTIIARDIGIACRDQNIELAEKCFDDIFESGDNIVGLSNRVYASLIFVLCGGDEAMYEGGLTQNDDNNTSADADSVTTHTPKKYNLEKAFRVYELLKEKERERQQHEQERLNRKQKNGVENNTIATENVDANTIVKTKSNTYTRPPLMGESSYAVLIRALSAANMLDRAYVLLKEMCISEGIKPKLRVFSAILNGFSFAGDVENTYGLYNQILAGMCGRVYVYLHVYFVLVCLCLYKS